MNKNGLMNDIANANTRTESKTAVVRFAYLLASRHWPQARQSLVISSTKQTNTCFVKAPAAV